MNTTAAFRGFLATSLICCLATVAHAKLKAVLDRHILVTAEADQRMRERPGRKPDK